MDVNLLWYAIAPSKRIHPSVTPTWSWASVDGPVKYFPQIEHAARLATITSVHIDGPLSKMAGYIELCCDCRVGQALRTTSTWEWPSKDWRPQRVSGYQLSAPEETLFGSAYWMPDETPTANVAVWFGAIAVQYQDDHVYALVLRPDAVAR